MGSTAQGVLTGFVCRLCSKMNRYVVLIYGEEGVQKNLLEKINSYLPVQIKKDDPLPKTVCLPCMNMLESHHSLMLMIQQSRKVFEDRMKQANNVSEEDDGEDDNFPVPGCSTSSTNQG